MYKVAPLSKSFFLTGILGFLVVLIYTLYGTLSVTWGFTFGLVFVIMVVASMISMTYGPLEELK